MRVSFLLIILFASVTSAEEPIKLGANLGLSGNVARYGQWGTRGITLALEHINHGKNTNSRKFSVIYEDNEGNPAKAVSAYQKLRNLDKIEFVFTFLSSVALTIAPLANRDHVVQIDFSATTPKYSSIDDYTFRTGIVATELASQAAKIIFEQFSVKEIGCLYIENDFGQGMYDVFKKQFAGNIKITETFRAEDTDFKAQLLKLKASKVNSIWLVGHLNESGIILKQARELGIHAQFYSDIYSIEGPDFLTAAGKQANGLIYIAPQFDINQQNSVTAEFAKKYQEKYSEEATLFAAQAYDAVLALAAALNKCSKPTADCAKEKLYSVNFEGASGQISFDRSGDVSKQITLKTIKNSEFVPYLGQTAN
jgi:branched-chain amino acid transport system substrate-binding protein